MRRLTGAVFQSLNGIMQAQHHLPAVAALAAGLIDRRS